MPHSLETQSGTGIGGGSSIWIGTISSLQSVSDECAEPTPLKAGQKESKIEAFFDDATRAITVGGKTFSDQNDADETEHYGKWILAEKVIAPNAKTIDFHRFCAATAKHFSRYSDAREAVSSAEEPPTPASHL